MAKAESGMTINDGTRRGRVTKKGLTLGLAVALTAIGMTTLRAASPKAAVAAADAAPAPVVKTPGAIPPVNLDQLSPVPARQWGVVGEGTSYTAAKPEVWDFAEIGNTMYVGGTFTGVQRDGDDPASKVIDQSYLAAFDRDSGEWISTFRPTFDRTVYTLEVAPNGKLLVGGEFTTVNGVPRTGIVMLDPVTGEIDPNFKASAQGNKARVKEIVRDGSQIYVVGQFSHLHGFPQDPFLWNAARLDALTGQIDLTWIPKFMGGLWDITIDHDHGFVEAVGYFTSESGRGGTARFATLMTSAPKLPPGGFAGFTPNDPNQTDTTSVTYANGRVYVGGAQHMVQVLNATNDQRIGWNTTGVTCTEFNPVNCGKFYGGGDMQTMEVTTNGIVLAGCHCFGPQVAGATKPLHYSTFTNTFTDHRFVLDYNTSDSKPASSFIPYLKYRRWGTYAIDTDSRGCLYIGGDYNRDAWGRWLGGFARFCPYVTPPTGLTATSASGAVQLKWNAPASQFPIKRYVVFRNGAYIGPTTGTTFNIGSLPKGSTQTFNVAAQDITGRQSGAPEVKVVVNGSDTQAPMAPTPATATVAGTTVTLNWTASTDLPNPGGVGVKEYQITRDGAACTTLPAGTLTVTDTGVTAGKHTYAIRAVDINKNVSAPATVEVAGAVPDTVAPTVPLTPAATVKGNTVTLTWGASTDLPDPGGVGLSGYLIHKDGSYLKLVKAGTLTTTDLGVTPGTHRYQVRAVDKKNNISSPATTVTITVP
jgi:hypothetical protein